MFTLPHAFLLHLAAFPRTEILITYVLILTDSHTLTEIAAPSLVSPNSILSLCSRKGLYISALFSSLKFHLAELILSLTLPLCLNATFLIRLSHIWHPLLSGLVNKHFSCDAEPEPVWSLSPCIFFFSSPEVFLSIICSAYFMSFLLLLLIDMLLFQSTLHCKNIFASPSEACDLTF